MSKIRSEPKKYQLLKQEIKSWILSGKLRPNEKLMTELDLSTHFSISRQTVRQAIGELENEGLLYRIQGSGTFVKEWVKPLESDNRNIGIITTFTNNYIFPDILHGIKNVLSDANYGIYFASSDNIQNKERVSLENLMTKPLSGLIIEPTFSALPSSNLVYYLTLEERGIPYVMTNSGYPQLPAPTITLNDEKGAFLAVEHLVELGHTRIAGIFNSNTQQGINRMKGYIRGLKQFKLPVYNHLIASYKYDDLHVSPSQSFREMWKRPIGERPSALVCYNDELTILLLDTFRSMGLSIPAELSIVSFDDSAFATATEVKLTSIAHPKEELGRRAAELLISMIEQGNTQADDVIFDPQLIIRQSTAAFRPL